MHRHQQQLPWLLEYLKQKRAPPTSKYFAKFEFESGNIRENFPTESSGIEIDDTNDEEFNDDYIRDDDVILFTDAYDVVVTTATRRLVKAVSSSHAPLMICGEKGE